MATSRTGTSKWLKVRRRALALGIDQGIHNCPICGALLDYERTRQPNSAEPDHILPYTKGGQDVIENIQVICRTCNIRKGNGRRKRPVPKQVQRAVPETGFRW